MKIGDLFLALQVESADFAPAIKREAEKAGKEGGTTLSKALSTSLKAGAVLVSGAFALMTKGALEMERAQGKFMAATGASREEAVAFTKDMNSLVGTAATVGMTFEDITDTGTMVAQQFGTTGDATRELTDDVLAFSKVTGQDATQAAADLEDTLSAYGLSADDAAGFMDKLVASNQTFGTNVGPEALAVLRNMSPALQTMGQDLDDGIGLLNLFEMAGLDAGSAQRGLNAAITKLPEGQSLDEFITHLADLKSKGLDPTKEAIEIFGNRAGPALAAAIQPGMTSLGDFSVDAEEAAGSVDQAAEDMLTTSDKFRMFAEKAGGFLRGLGQDFGPLVTSIGTIGPLIATALAGSWRTIKDSKLVQVAVTAAGAAAGAAYHAAASAGEALADAIKAAWTRVISSGPMRTVIAAAGTAAGLVYAAAAAAGEQLMQLIDAAWVKVGLPNSRVLTAAGGAGTVAGLAFAAAAATAIATGGLLALQQSFDFLKNWIEGGAGGKVDGAGDAFANVMTRNAPGRYQQAGQAIGTDMVAGATTAVTEGGEHLGDDMVAAFLRNKAPWGDLTGFFNQVGERAVEETGQGYIANKDNLAADARETMRFANQAMMAEAANAKKVTDALADGLLDGIPTVRDAWRQFKEDMKNQLDPMKEIAWLEARLSGDKLAEGLESKNPLTRRKAELMRDSMMAELEQLKQLMGQAATDGSNSLANNLDGTKVEGKARTIMSKVEGIFSRQLKIDAPTIAGFGTVGGVGGKRKKRNRATGGHTPAGWTWTGEYGPELQYFDRPSYIIPNSHVDDAQAAAAGPGPTFNVPISIYGDPDPATVRGAVRDGILDATGLRFSLRHAGGLQFKGSPG